LQRALALWDPDELKGTPRDNTLAVAAEEFERFFRHRGGHRETIILLGVEITLRPEDAQARGRFDDVVTWMRGDENEQCSESGCERLIGDLEAAVAAFPAPFLVDRLAALYWQRQQGATVLGPAERPRGSDGQDERRRRLAELLRRRSGQQRTAFDLA